MSNAERQPIQVLIAGGDYALDEIAREIGFDFRHALTLDDRRLDEQLHGLIQDAASAYV